MESLFVVNVRLPEEYKGWVNDMIKAFIVLTTIHVLQHTVAGNNTSRGLFSADFWRLIIFAMIGFSAYYLVFRKIIRFQYTGGSDNALHSITVAPLQIIQRFKTWLKNKL